MIPQLFFSGHRHTNQYSVGRRTAKHGGAKPSTLSNGSGFPSNAPSTSISSNPAALQDGKGMGNDESKGLNIPPVTKKTHGKLAYKLAPPEKLEPLPCPHSHNEKETKLPEPDTPGLKKKGQTKPHPSE